MSFSLPLILSLLAPPPDGKDYEQTTAELESAIENFASGDRQASIQALETTLDLAGRYPDHALRDHSVPGNVLQGWVILAGLYLAEGDATAAAKVMDQAIRVARGQTLPVHAYGPKVTQLYEDRIAALQAVGMATIEVDCETDCEIVINQRLLPEPREKLLLGSYDVWVKAREGNVPWEYHQVELSKADAVVTILYKGPAPKPVASVAPTMPNKPKRMLPRGVEIAGLAVGVGLAVAGAVLLSFDGKCDISKERPTADTTPEACGNIYESSPAGFSLVGVGGGLLFVSGVMLSVDEVRVGRARGHRAMFGVSLKF
jgi:hypothetical protein